MRHGVAADSAAAGVIALEAGVDVDMVSSIYLNHVARLVRAGVIRRALVDEAVRRVLRAKYLLGLFADPYRYSDAARERARIFTPEHLAAAREMARNVDRAAQERGGRAAAVARRCGRLAVIGPLATTRPASLRLVVGGRPPGGRGHGAATASGARRARGTRVVLRAGRRTWRPTTRPDSPRPSGRRAQADAVVLVLGEHAGHERRGPQPHARSICPACRSELARARPRGGQAAGGGAHERPSAVDRPGSRANVPAILETWYLGVQTGPAVADVLFGDYNPGGKLPGHLAARRWDRCRSTTTTRTPAGRPSRRDNYTSKYLDVPWTPLYPVRLRAELHHVRLRRPASQRGEDPEHGLAHRERGSHQQRPRDR